MDSIFTYLEYRDFLKAHYEYMKKNHACFSYRYIAGKVGVDASYYVKVLQKQMHISDKSTTRFVQFLKLKKREEEYFKTLVKFNKAKQHDQIKFYFEKLISLRNPVAHKLDADKYEFFNKWYYIAVRELLNVIPFKGNYKELAARLVPPISRREAEKAVALLEKLGMVRKNEDGVYELTQQFITTGDAWRPIAIRNFQKAIMQLGTEALERVSREDRDISTVTISTSKSTFETIKERLSDMRKEIMELAKNDVQVDDVYQVTIQVFPLSKTRTAGKKRK
ncbi:MAG: TIGR02147 family protein [Chitinivibrionales bacterium]|nr:TIGR02147 family protein [Chitinivibrionales bacterium]